MHETNADALSTLKNWSISRSLLSMSYAFSSYFPLQVLGSQKVVWLFEARLHAYYHYCWFLGVFHILILLAIEFCSNFYLCTFVDVYFCLFISFNSWSRRELLHSYGFEHMATLNNLEKAGLLRKQVWCHFAFII